MSDFFTRLFDPSGFVPRRVCGDWTPGLVWLHNASDALIWLAYLAIPLVLLVIARRRKDVPFRAVYFLFIAFILTCGFTHFLEVVMFYSPLYRLSGLLKAVTAVASWATVIALVPVVPKVFAMRSPEELETEIAERRRAEGDLRALHAELEERVTLRTAELEGAVAALRAENEERKRVERQLKESERLYRAIGESIDYGVWVCAPDGRNTYASPSFLKLVGISQEQCSSFGWGEVLHPDDAEGTMSAWRECVRVRGKWDREHRFLGVDGQYHPVLARGIPVEDEHGKLLCWAGINLDISRQKWAEQELKELNASLERRITDGMAIAETERRMLDAILESLPVAVIISDPDGRLLRLNKAHERIWGGSPMSSSTDEYGEWVGYWPDTGERVQAHEWALSRSLLKGEVCPGELVEIEPFGLRERRFIINSAAPVRGPGGNIIAGVVASMDVTDRIKAESALRESEERFRSAFDSAPIGMALVALDGRWLQVNRLLCGLVGYTEQELLATNFQAITHPDDLDADMGHIRRVIEGAIQTYQMEKRYFHKRGHVVHILLSVSLVRDGSGQPLYFVAQIKDITQQKEDEKVLAANEELLRQFIKHSPASIAMFDRDMIYMQTSDRWLIDYHLSGRDIIGLSHYEVFPDILESWKAVHQRVMAGSVEQCEEDPFERADGSTEWLQWECRPWRNAEGDVGGIIMFTQVITERKVIAERVKASLREKEVLLKEIHHRVKNNLQVVSTLLDLQSGHTTDPAATEMFKESRGRVKSMALIHERLYRSQDMARVNIGEYVRQLAGDLHRTYRVSEGIRLELDVDVPPLSIDIAIPCGLLLNELISNCFKHAFAATAEGCLRVALHREDGANVLTVADDGAGFPAGTDFQNTTSFGLQLVNTLVDQLNGEISLTTDRGTTFTVRFPRPSSTATGTLP